MHNIVNLKRAVATLAAAAGLLAAAAGPANAQILPGMIGLTVPNAGQGREVSSDTLCTDSNQLAIEDLALTREPARTVTCLDQDLNSLKDNQIKIGGAEAAGFVKAPVKTWTDGDNQPSGGAAFRGEVIGLEPTVKAPTPAGLIDLSDVP